MFALGAATLMFEVLLTRIAAVTLFANLAFGVIALSLFGLALGSAFAERHAPDDDRVLVKVLLAAALFTLVSAALATKLPLVPDELVYRGKIVSTYTSRRESFDSDPGQIRWSLVALLVVCQAVPFAMAGYAQARMFTLRKADAAKLYAADLAGAMLGALSTLGLLRGLGAVDSLAVVAVLFVIAALPRERNLRIAGGVGVALSILVLVTRPFDITHAAGFSERHIVAVDWSSLARIGLYEPDELHTEPLLVVDNTSATEVIFAGAASTKQNLERIPYSLRPEGDVLIIGAGGGQEIESALATAPDRKRHVDAVELAGGEERLMRRAFGQRPDFLLTQPGVEYRIADGRSFIEGSNRQWDVVQMKEVNFHSFAGQAASAWTPSLLFTSEAIRTELEHLTEHGFLAITKGLYYGGEVAAATEMIATLRGAGDALGRPLGPRFVMIDRAKQSGSQRLYLIANTPFTDAELVQIQTLADESGLTVKRSPHRLYPPIEGAINEAIPRNAPMTDNQPFGNRYFRRTDDRVLGYATAFLGILALLVLARSALRVPEVDRRVAFGQLVICGLLGVGFMLLEVVLVERVSLLLGHPTVGFVTVLTAMLCGLGAGSIASERVRPETATRRAIILAVATLVIVGGMCVVPVVAASWFRSFDAGVRPWLIGALLLLATTPLGMLLPTVIRGATASAAGCWSINAACSVLGTLAAALLVRTMGFAATGRLACFLYACALGGWLVQRAWRTQPEAESVPPISIRTTDSES